MTVEDIEKAAAAFRFVGGFSMWKPTIRVRRDTGLPVLWLEIAIPDSADLDCRRMQALNTGVDLADLSADANPVADALADTEPGTVIGIPGE